MRTADSVGVGTDAQVTDKEDVVGGRGRAAGWPETGSGGGPGVRAAEGGRVKSKREWSGLSVVCVASSFRKYSLHCLFW